MSARLEQERRAADEWDAHLLHLARLLFFQVKTPAETLDAASAVENALLAGKEGMAFRADIHAQILLDAPCLKRIATGTRHRCFNKIGVNSGFHRSLSLSFEDTTLEV
jgi:hypothetical protein